MEKNLKILFVSLLVALLLVGGYLSSSVLDSIAKNETKKITVSGTSTVRATPDNSVISFGVVTKGDTAKEAMGSNADKMNKVMQALKALGIEEKYIQTTGISLYPEYEYPKPESTEKPRIIGYVATNRLTVTIVKISSTGDVIDRVVEAGVNQIDGIYFKLSDERAETLRIEALEKAVANAKVKADAIAKALNTKITATLQVTESGEYFPPIPISRGYGIEELKGSTTPVSPGELEVKASVQVTYVFG